MASGDLKVRLDVSMTKPCGCVYKCGLVERCAEHENGSRRPGMLVTDSGVPLGLITGDGVQHNGLARMFSEMSLIDTEQEVGPCGCRVMTSGRDAGLAIPCVDHRAVVTPSTIPKTSIGIAGREVTMGVDVPHVRIRAASFSPDPIAMENAPVDTATEDRIKSLVDNLTNDEADLAYFLLHQRGCRYDSAVHTVRRMRKSG